MGAKTEIATARRSGHTLKEFTGLANIGIGPRERQPRAVKKEKAVFDSNLDAVFHCVT